MESTDWIGVGLIVAGLVLIAAALMARKSRKGSQGGIEGNLHPSLERDLSEEDPGDEAAGELTMLDAGDDIEGMDAERAGAGVGESTAAPTTDRGAFP